MSRSRLTLALLACLAACKDPSLRLRRAVPQLAKLPVIDTIASPDSLPVSSALGTRDCRVLIADGKGGRLIIGSPPAVIATIPGRWRFPYLAPLDSTSAFVWSTTRPYLGVVNYARRTLDSLPVARDAWGQPALGPITSVSDSAYAVEPRADPSLRRRAPDHAAPVSLVELRARDGDLVGDMGHPASPGGRYLLGRASQGAIGRQGDTILVALASPGLLLRFTEGGLRVDTIQLPRYFDPPATTEEIRLVPWLQIHGELVNIVEAPALGAAAFSPDGQLYVIRNYWYRWHRTTDRLFRSGGTWETTVSGLEIYTAHGRLLGAYARPSAGRVPWLTADGVGRIFVDDGVRVWMLRDPTVAPRCTTGPRSDPRAGRT